MSSKELTTTFSNAASIIAIRLKNLDGVEKVLGAVRERIDTADEINPRRNPRLKIDPVLFAQRVAAPRSTVEAVLGELRRFNFAHVWARAICPTEQDDVDSVLVETDRAAEFERELAQGCHVCGQRHDQGAPPIIETFFALNIGEEKERFQLRRFLIGERELKSIGGSRPHEENDTVDETPYRTWCQRFFHYGAWMPSEAETVVDATSKQLSLNAPSSQTPSPRTVALLVMGGLLLYPIVSTALVCVCYYFWGVVVAFAAAILSVIGAAFAIYVAMRYVFAISMQRRLLMAGHTVSIGLFLKSTFDFEFHFEQGKPLQISGGAGEVEVGIAIVAAVVWILTIIGVVALTWIDGWFAAAHR